MRALELNAQTQGTQGHADKPTREINKNWWAEKKASFH